MDRHEVIHGMNTRHMNQQANIKAVQNVLHKQKRMNRSDMIQHFSHSGSQTIRTKYHMFKCFSKIKLNV